MEKREHSRIAIIIGTKAELIKCVPVMLELQKREKDYWFIHTGQHPLKDSSKNFGVKEPDFIIRPEPKASTKYWSKIKLTTFLKCWGILFDIRKLIRKLKPKYVVYHGDTMSTAMAAGASCSVMNPFKKWKNVHLEAGLESGSLFEPMPEEFTRQIISRFTDVLFAVSDLAEKNLQKRINFVGGKIIKVGNTIVDSALIIYEKAQKKKHKIPKEKYFLINVHRYENLRDKKRLQKIIEMVKQTQIKGIWPLHDNTRKHLEVYGLMEEVENIKNIEIISLIRYDEFIFLLANSEYIMADGGSIQEESLIFKKPYLILRKYTERQEGLLTGINFLTKLNVDYSRKIIKEIEQGKIKKTKFTNPYGEKGLSGKIVGYLLNKS